MMGGMGIQHPVSETVAVYGLGNFTMIQNVYLVDMGKELTWKTGQLQEPLIF